MSKKFIFLSGLTAIIALTSVFFSNYEKEFTYPGNWPAPSYDFSENPISKEKIELGRQLFYDPKLSGDGTISCASCHLSFTGFTHIDHRVSHGIYDRIGTRNTQSLINIAWQKNFMWDGSVQHLDFQPLAPLTNPLEMDGNVDSVLLYLQNSAKYQKLFKAAFGDTVSPSIPKMLKALSQFMLQMNSFNSKYDKVMRGEEGVAFNPYEQRGYELFKKNCSSCHPEPLFTNGNFENNGLSINPKYKDGGRIKVTGKLEDSLKFKVPTLRNIEATYPYMHDGRFKSLQMVLHHYNHDIQQTINLSPSLKAPMDLTDEEKRDIILFLKTLTDREFLYNMDLAFPRDMFE